MPDTAPMRRESAPLDELLRVARGLGADEQALLLLVARDLLRRHRRHGALRVATDVAALRPASVAAFASRLVGEAEVHLSRVRMAAALLCAYARDADR